MEWKLTHLCQRNGQTSHTASTITDTLSSNISIGRNPVQNLLNGLVMTTSNIQLYRVDISTLRIDLVPSAEPLCVEIFTNFGLVVDARKQRRVGRSRGGRDKRGCVICRQVEKRKNGTDSLHFVGVLCVVVGVRQLWC